MSDFNDINTELILSDITTLESITNRITKSKTSEKEKNLLKAEAIKALDKLNNNKFLQKKDLDKVQEFFPDIKLLTQKPMFVMLILMKIPQNRKLMISLNQCQKI